MALETQAIRNVSKNYQSRNTDMKYGARIDEDGLMHMTVWDFNYNDLPVNGTTNQEHVIPAGSTIVSAKLRIVSAFTSTSTTTDLTVGLRTKNAVAEDIDDDGLITAVNASQTTIGTAGNLITGSGALVGASIGASDGELYVAPNVADLLTGRGQVIVEYMIPAASPA